MVRINKKARLKALLRIHGIANEDRNIESDWINDRDDFAEISDKELSEAMEWVEKMIRSHIKKLNCA